MKPILTLLPFFIDSFEFTCELDEYTYLKKELQESGILKDFRNGLKNYKNAFLGKDAVDWLVETKNLGILLFTYLLLVVIKKNIFR